MFRGGGVAPISRCFAPVIAPEAEFWMTNCSGVSGVANLACDEKHCLLMTDRFHRQACMVEWTPAHFCLNCEVTGWPGHVLTHCLRNEAENQVKKRDPISMHVYNDISYHSKSWGNYWKRDWHKNDIKDFAYIVYTFKERLLFMPKLIDDQPALENFLPYTQVGYHGSIYHILHQTPEISLVLMARHDYKVLEG